MSTPDYDDSVHLIPGDPELGGADKAQASGDAKIGTDDDTVKVKLIVTQSQASLNNGEQLSDTLFYSDVQEGNVDTVSQAIEALGDHPEVMQWLKGPQKRAIQEKPNKGLCGRASFVDVLYFMVSCFFIFILTPGFYVLHHITNWIICNKDNESVTCSCLPLYMACRSLNEDMVRLVLSMGVSVEDCDDLHYNVFHYIAEHARIDTEVAIEMMGIMVKIIDDIKLVRKLLSENKNNKGMTALELSIEDASTEFYEYIMQHKGIMAESLHEVKDSHIVSDKLHRVGHDIPSHQTFVDVTPYERGPYLKHSKILNLICNVNCTRMTEKALSFVNRTSFIGSWMSAKVRQKLVSIILVQLFDGFQTAIFVYYVATVLNTDYLQTQKDRAYSYGLTREIQARQNGSSFYWHKSIFPSVQHRLQLHVAHNLLEKRLDTTLLYEDFNDTVAKAFVGQKLHLLPDHIVNNFTLDDLFNKANKHCKAENEKLLVTNLGMLTQTFAKGILKEHSILFEGGSPRLHFNETLQLFDKYCEYFKKVCKEKYAHLLNSTNMRSIFCVPMSLLSQNHCKSNISFHAPEIPYFSRDMCDRYASEHIANSWCRPSLAKTLFDKVSKIDKYPGPFFMFSWLFMIISSLTFICLDFYERVTLAYYVRVERCIENKIRTYFSVRIPGSYIRKQLSVVAHGLTLGYLFLTYMGGNLDAQHWVVVVSKYLMILALLTRFILHIHTLRLLPFIGHFITTTFTMLQTISYFAVVYVGILFIFAVMFQLLARRDECPVHEGRLLSTVGEWMFSAFQLAFGHGDLDMYFTPTAVRFAYILHVTVIALMLLNLLIAMMTVTAEEINKYQYQKALIKIEILKEALSIEHTILAMFKQGQKTCIPLDKKSGFHAKRIGKRYHYYILAPKRRF